MCRDLGAEGGYRTGVGVLELDGWDVAAGAVQTAVVEPVDVLENGELHVVEPSPGPAAADELGLVEPDEGLGGGVVVGVALVSDDLRPGSGRCLTAGRPS